MTKKGTVAKSSWRKVGTMPKPRKKAKKGPTVSKLKKKLDAIFSQYIRARDKNVCYTCDRVLEQNKSQNGHFVPRQYLATRWDERNNHCQCWWCNVRFNGHPSIYAIKLVKEYGYGIIEELESKRREIVKLKPDWYEEQIKIYQEKLIALDNV